MIFIYIFIIIIHGNDTYLFSIQSYSWIYYYRICVIVMKSISNNIVI